MNFNRGTPEDALNVGAKAFIKKWIRDKNKDKNSKVEISNDSAPYMVNIEGNLILEERGDFGKTWYLGEVTGHIVIKKLEVKEDLKTNLISGQEDSNEVKNESRDDKDTLDKLIKRIFDLFK